MSLFSSIANSINSLDIPLEFLHKGIFHRLLVKISFKASNSDVMQIRIHSIELSDASVSDELSIFEQNVIDQDKEQIQKYIENIRKISDANAVYLGISLQHDTIHFEKLTEEQYKQLIEVLYNELREPKQQQQQSKQELTQDQITTRRKELQKQLNEINTKYNKKYETEMEKIEARHKVNVRMELAAYNRCRTDLRKRLEAAEKDETKAITDELEQLKQKVKPPTINLSNTYEELVKNFLSMINNTL